MRRDRAGSAMENLNFCLAARDREEKLSLFLSLAHSRLHSPAVIVIRRGVNPGNPWSLGSRAPP